MEIEDIAHQLADIQHELAELRASIDQLAHGPLVGEKPEELAPEPPKETVTTTSDESGGMAELLSALGSAGGLELVASLLGGNGKKIANLAPLLGLLQGGRNDSEDKLVSALSEMGPEMRKVASKLQGVLPVVQMISKTQRGASTRKKADTVEDKQRFGPAPSLSVSEVGGPVSVRPIHSAQSQGFQDWGAWSINRLPKW